MCAALILVLQVVRQVGKGRLDYSLIASRRCDLDTFVQRGGIRLAQHGRSAEKQTANPGHLALFKSGADQVGPDLTRRGFIHDSDLLKSFVHRLARGGNGIGRALEGRLLSAIGLRDHVSRHERRGDQGAVEDQGGIGRKRYTTFATAIHQARFRLTSGDDAISLTASSHAHPCLTVVRREGL